jgi:hypothetical protein
MPRSKRLRMLVIGVALVAAAGVVVAIGAGLRRANRPIPEFPSLADSPDPSLEGTVAYYDTDAGCVRVVDASGAASEDAYCFDADDDENGPQLAFRPDGRLEVTMYSWPQGGELSAKWQRLVDVGSGEVEEVPIADVPEKPTQSPIPAVGPDGQTVTYESKSGTITVTLTSDAGTRTLLSATGPEGGYQVSPGGQPVWSPDGDWIVLDEGRLLLITTADPSQTRVLVDPVGGLGSYRSFEVRLFAVADTTLARNAG